MISAFLSPNLAFLLLITGALAIYWELVVPGTIVPGILGAVLLITGAWTVSQHNPTWYGTAGIVLGLVLLGLEIKIYSQMVLGLAGTVALALGAMVLIRGPFVIVPTVAIPLAAAFGIVTVFLGRRAVQARDNKRLVGEQLVLDEIGSAQTDINPEGTVIVRGEYWRARSTERIAQGDRIYVVQVRGMELDVMPLGRPTS